MDNAVTVGVVERSRHFDGKPYRLADRELFVARKPISQRLTLDKRHHVLQLTLIRPRVDQAKDMGVLQTGGGLDFLQESLGTDDGRRLGPEDLHGDFAVVFEVLGQVHRSDPTGTEFTLDRIAISERRHESGLGVGHSRLVEDRATHLGMPVGERVRLGPRRGARGGIEETRVRLGSDPPSDTLGCLCHL